MGTTDTTSPLNSGGAREKLRREMPISQKWAYFDHAAVSPLPDVTQRYIADWSLQASLDGCVSWPDWSAQVERLRKLIASLLNAHQDEIALVPNTTTGINLISEGIRWKAGENVVVLENEFPSNLLPWENLNRRGVELRTAPVEPDGSVDLSRLAARIDSNTRIVSVSWVGFASGYRLDLGALSQLVHEKGCLLMVDAIQGLGVFPLDVRASNIDFLAADGHKWMLGPEGAGLLFIRQALLETLDPVLIGWGSVRNAMQFSSVGSELKTTASRYEAGSANMVGLGAFATSLQLLMELECNRLGNPVSEAVHENAELLTERLRQFGAQVEVSNDRFHQSGIVLFQIPGQDPMSVRKQLLEQRVVLSCRNDRLRASTHAYNNIDDIDRLIDALGRCSN